MSDRPDAVRISARAASDVQTLAQLVKPAVTTLDAGDLYDLTGSLARLVSALPQTLTQLGYYLPRSAAVDKLAPAARIALELAAALDTAHQHLAEVPDSALSGHRPVASGGTTGAQNGPAGMEKPAPSVDDAG